MKTFIFRSIIGIFFGAFIAVVITNSRLIFGGMVTIDGSLFLKNSLGSIFCGWFFTVSPMYFQIKKWTLPQQTLFHFLTVMLLYFILAISIGWIPFHLQSILITLCIALVVYGGFWSSFYLYYKNEARKLNEDLNKLC